MPQVKIVLDTSGLLRCISRKSKYSIVLTKLFENEYELNVTTDILLEYEEKIAEIFSVETADRCFYATPQCEEGRCPLSSSINCK
jgi:uncharacterized protein